MIAMSKGFLVAVLPSGYGGDGQTTSVERWRESERSVRVGASLGLGRSIWRMQSQGR